MSQRPSDSLVRTLAMLHLAGERDWASVAPRVRKLARDLPCFDSLWIDALQQTQRITAYQAAELHAGRGLQLRLGPHLIQQRIGSAGCGVQYEAVHSDTRQRMLLVVQTQEPAAAEAALARLKISIAKLGESQQGGVHGPISAGYEGQQLWAAGPLVSGERAAHWLVEFGRFPGEAVLEIARQLVACLAGLEAAQLTHGEITAYQLLLTRSGRISLPLATWRSAVRPTESLASADLPAEAFDGLAPERLIHGSPPSVASEMYACGALLWQLAAGRTPLAGGNALGKLRAAQEGRIPEIRRYAPQLGEPLTQLIGSLLQMAPAARPVSFAQVARELGPPTAKGQSCLRGCLRNPLASAPRVIARSPRRVRKRRKSPKAAVVQGLGLLFVALLAGSWLGRTDGPTTPPEGGVAQVSAGSGLEASTDSTRPGAANDGQSISPTEPVEPAIAPEPSRPDESPPRAPTQLVSTRRSAAQTLVLPSGEVTRLTAEQLEQVSVVRCEGGRAIVELPENGLTIAGAEIEFEAIDFVWPPVTANPADAPRQPAMLILRVGHARFVGCRFRSFGDVEAVAIRWQGSTETEGDQLRTGLLEINRSVLENVAAVQLQTYGAMSVRATGTLHLGPGPLVRLTRCPAADEPVAIVLERCTLRGAGSVLECGYRRLEARPASISLASADCVFAGEDGALISFAGPTSPEAWLPSMAWKGQGSVMEDSLTVVQWRDFSAGDGVASDRPVDEQRLAVEGLVRSRLEFAGPAGAGPAASRLVRCQAPLRSVELPGIQGSSLPHEQP